MIISILINILELVAIVYLLWILYEQVSNNEHFNDLLECAVKELEKTRDDKTYWYKKYYSKAVDNVQEIRKYKNKLEEIREIVKNSNQLPCTDFYADCGNCKDETTDNGKTCMRKGLKKILEVIEGKTDINNIVGDTVHIQKIGDVIVKDYFEVNDAIKRT